MGFPVSSVVGVDRQGAFRPIEALECSIDGVHLREERGGVLAGALGVHLWRTGERENGGQDLF